MSVQRNHYVMTGIVLDYDNFYKRVGAKYNMDKDTFFEEIESLYNDGVFEGIHHHNGVCIISDGASGRYVYVGFVLYKSSPDGDLNDFASPNVPIDDDIGDNIVKATGINGLPQILAFTHYR